MKHKIILETPRTYLRELSLDDFDSVAVFLQNIEVMYAWEHAFSPKEVRAWLEENLLRYKRDGYSYWAVVEKKSGAIIGVCGILEETVGNEHYTGIGYIFDQAIWHKGFALECAQACKNYAFGQLGVKLLTAQIRPDNIASIKVAEKLGMSVIKPFQRLSRRQVIPHLLYGCSQ